MRIKRKPVAEVQTLLIPASLNAEMTTTLKAWKALGNKWLFVMEANLELFASGKKVVDNETGEISLPCVRTLVYLGYMVERKGGLTDGWVTTFRLSESGKKVAGIVDTLPEPPGRGRAKAVQEKQLSLVDSLEECPACEGSGADDKGNVCNKCYGTGERTVDIKSKELVQSKQPKENAASWNAVATKRKTAVRRK